VASLEVMAGCGSSKRKKLAPVLPQDLLRIIFSRLDFHDKIRSGLVCKQWDQFLKTGTLPAKHWDVHYDVDKVVSSRDCAESEVIRGQITDGIGRYATLLALSHRRRFYCICK
jgi:hypothetical protein